MSSKRFTNNQQTVMQEESFLGILQAHHGEREWAVWRVYESNTGFLQEQV